MAKVYTSTIIEAPIDRVWAKLRDFNGVGDWLPGIVGSTIEDGRPSDAVGAVRVMDIGDAGDDVREQLLALSDHDHSCTYAVLAGPLPVSKLVATIRLRPVTDREATFGEWSAEFEPAPGSEDKAGELLGKVFRAGWRGLKAHLGA